MAKAQATGARRTLKLCGFVILLVAVLDLWVDILGYALPTGQFSYDSIVADVGANDANWMMLTLVGLSILSFVIMIFIGAKAIIVANGGRKSKFADFCVWVGIIIAIIDIAITIYCIATGKVSFLESHIITQVCGLILLFMYISMTKKVSAANQTQA